MTDQNLGDRMNLGVKCLSVKVNTSGSGPSVLVSLHFTHFKVLVSAY